MHICLNLWGFKPTYGFGNNYSSAADFWCTNGGRRFSSYFEIIKDEAKDFLSRFIIDITLPCLIFSTFAKIEGNSSLLINGAIVFGFTFINLAVALATGTISSKLQGLNPASTTVHSLHTMFGNIVFLGYPLFDALFPGGVGIFYAAAYQLASNSITFTYGIYRLSSGQKNRDLKAFWTSTHLRFWLAFPLLPLGLKFQHFLSMLLAA